MTGYAVQPDWRVLVLEDTSERNHVVGDFKQWLLESTEKAGQSATMEESVAKLI